MSHPRNQKIKTRFALVTTSDTRIPETDETGKLAHNLIEEDGHEVVAYLIVQNDLNKIRKTLESLIEDEGVRVILTSGGTGIGSKDKTVDTILGLLEKEIPGFGELFRRLSYQEIGGPGIMSRATAGVASGKLIFCLPGSKGAMKTGLERIILPTVGHMLWELDRR
jgi:molybdenum cofactor biosynthesis protein B